MWVSDGLPTLALQELRAVAPEESWRRLPLVGGVTVWDRPPSERVTAAVACPNRLGVFEQLPPGGLWEQLWWWSDPLDAHRSRYLSAPRVQRVAVPGVDAPADRSLREGALRSRRAADYLARRLRQLRGVAVPKVPRGRRFPVLLPVPPGPLLSGVAEEIAVPRPVDGWPGLVVCELGWWQSTNRLKALVEAMARALGGEKPAGLVDADRVWSSPGP